MGRERTFLRQTPAGPTTYRPVAFRPSMTSATPVFQRQGDLWVPTALALSPWSAELIHGGPTGALVAHAVETLKPDPTFLISRLTIDMFRPVPARPLRAAARLVRQGRRIAAAEVSVFDGDVEVTRASALMLRTQEVDIPTASTFGRRDLPAPEAVPERSIFSRGRTREQVPPGFHLHIEVRQFRDEPAIGGGRSVGAWLRFPYPLFEGEEVTPYLHAASLADFANGLGGINAGEGSGFINCDVTLTIHRQPEGEWVCMEVESGAGPSGVGSNHAVLSDTRGVFGKVTQSLLLNPRAPRVP